MTTKRRDYEKTVLEYFKQKGERFLKEHKDFESLKSSNRNLQKLFKVKSISL